MNNFCKVVRLGTLKTGRGRSFSVFCKIEYKEGDLSVSGVEGPKRGGNALGSCGQIIMSYKEYDKRGYMSIRDIKPSPGWTHDKIKTFFDVWDKWHMNDMKAGTPRQEDYLETIRGEYPGMEHYKWATQCLANVGLNPDLDYDGKGEKWAVYPLFRPLVAKWRGVDTAYKYGHSWLFVPVPEEVLSFLASLPYTDINPAWV